MKNLILTFVIISSGMSNCQNKLDNSNIKKSTEDLIRMNDYAVKLSTIDNNNKDSTLKALSILNEVIRIDSTYLIAHNNRLSVLIKLREREKALSQINKIISIRKEDSSLYMIKGHILEKLNLKKEANKEYSIATTLCEKQIKENPKNVSLKTTLLMIHGFTQSAESVRAEYEALKKEYPSEPKVTMMEDIIMKFNKGEFLEMY